MRKFIEICGNGNGFSEKFGGNLTVKFLQSEFWVDFGNFEGEFQGNFCAVNFEVKSEVSFRRSFGECFSAVLSRQNALKESTPTPPQSSLTVVFTTSNC